MPAAFHESLEDREIITDGAIEREGEGESEKSERGRKRDTTKAQTSARERSESNARKSRKRANVFRPDDSREKPERIETVGDVAVIFRGGERNKSFPVMNASSSRCLPFGTKAAAGRKRRGHPYVCLRTSTYSAQVLPINSPSPQIRSSALDSETRTNNKAAGGGAEMRPETPRAVGDGEGRGTINSSGFNSSGNVIIFMTFRFKSNALLNRTSLCASSNLQRYFTEYARARECARVIPNNSMTSG